MHFAAHKENKTQNLFRLNRTFVFVLFRDLNQLDIDFFFSRKVDTNAAFIHSSVNCQNCFYFDLHVQNFAPKCKCVCKSKNSNQIKSKPIQNLIGKHFECVHW